MVNFMKPSATLIALSTVASVTVALASTPADARLFGKKQPPVDFSAALPQPVAPAPANGSIFQVSDGYAALHEGSRARRIGTHAHSGATVPGFHRLPRTASLPF
jgi:flagellar L-ring protein precursor FlgH